MILICPLPAPETERCEERCYNTESGIEQEEIPPAFRRKLGEKRSHNRAGNHADGSSRLTPNQRTHNAPAVKNTDRPKLAGKGDSTSDRHDDPPRKKRERDCRLGTDDIPTGKHRKPEHKKAERIEGELDLAGKNENQQHDREERIEIAVDDITRQFFGKPQAFGDPGVRNNHRSHFQCGKRLHKEESDIVEAVGQRVSANTFNRLFRDGVRHYSSTTR